VAQFFLEAFQWHDVKRGDAFAFYAGDIRVEGPHPFGRRTAGQGSGRDCAGGIHHAKQWRLDHVRQTPELTAGDTGDHRLAPITVSHVQCYWSTSEACVRRPIKLDP